MANYTNMKDILKQFELQVVQKKHYKKEEVYTQAETRDVISNAITIAIQGVNQFNIVKASSASNTPKGVEWTSGSTTIKGTLEAVAADRHTIYYVPSYNGTNDSYDEYMSLETGTSTYVWEKIGNTDVNLTNYSTLGETVSSINFDNTAGLYYIYANEHIATDKHKLGTAANWRTFLGATDTISDSNAGLATPKMVYNLQEKTVNKSSAGVALGGKVGDLTINVTGGSVANDTTGNSVVTGKTVYTYLTINYQPKNADLTAIAALTGTSGFLTKTATNTWALDTNTYLTTDNAEDTYLSQTDAADTYLSQTDAATTYLSKTAANSVYLSKTSASSTYLSKTDASSTYLSKNDASSTYLTLTAAGTTYAQRSEAVGYVDFNSTKGLRYMRVTNIGQMADSNFESIATIAELKSALLSMSDSDFSDILANV